MSRSPAPLHQTLADLLCEQWAEIRCHGCGRCRQHDVNDLLERLARHDWDVPLHDAARSLRCRDCGARAAQIALSPPVPRQRHLRLVPKDGRDG
jgi:tRNA(Ile2) C34 agmatinyltransferase TiaS